MILRSAEIRPDQTGHEAGMELLDKMYRELMGEPMPAIAVTEKGKPYFVEGDLHFSVSHTARRVFCVLAECPVGVDAEEEDQEVDLSLADKILSPREREQFDLVEDPRQALLAFRVLKEAAAKCRGEGLQAYPADTNFYLFDPRVMVRDGCVVAAIEDWRHEYV